MKSSVCNGKTTRCRKDIMQRGEDAIKRSEIAFAVGSWQLCSARRFAGVFGERMCTLAPCGLRSPWRLPNEIRRTRRGRVSVRLWRQNLLERRLRRRSLVNGHAITDKREIVPFCRVMLAAASRNCCRRNRVFARIEKPRGRRA